MEGQRKSTQPGEASCLTGPHQRTNLLQRLLQASLATTLTCRNSLSFITFRNGRHWIRTSDFHRVRMVRQAENHTPQELTYSMIRTDSTFFKGSVQNSVHLGRLRPGSFLTLYTSPFTSAVIHECCGGWSAALTQSCPAIPPALPLPGKGC
jgi:hypothetical protein